MDRSEISELSYITPISNTQSILAVGLLSHNRAARVEHVSIAKQGVQDIRAGKVVPGGLRLHDYVNLYFNPRNPMMFLRKDSHGSCCILRVSAAVLDEIEGVVIADQNAARFAAFRPAPEGLAMIDRAVTYAKYWTDADPFEQDRRKAAQCAEVLVPHVVPPSYLLGAYVSCESAMADLDQVGFTLPARLQPYLFFQS
jgi:ssDNA thymidine ADP-ribosyltransferase, DarT